MKDKINVMIFPCGAENALEIYNSIRYSVHVRVFGASSVDDMGALVHENYLGSLPLINSDNFDIEFERILAENSIDVIFATHDTVQEYLAAKNFKAYLVNGDIDTARITRSKKLTYELFKNKGWCSRFYDKKEECIEFPVICKPNMGQGAQGVYKCNDEMELFNNLQKIDDPVVVEYLPGKEITVDCFTDKNRNVIWAQPRTRERVKAGISMKSIFVELDSEIKTIVDDINKELVLRGPWFFQVKKDITGKWKLLEVSSRVAGTMVAQRAKGVNLPLMAIQDYMGRELTVLPLNGVLGVERAIFTKPILTNKYSKVYIDFDDTVVLGGLVVAHVISFVYEMVNQGKEIILITRHEDDVLESLNKYKISRHLFTSIVHIKDTALKSGYINSNDSIFIDNHFLERLDVYEKCGIPVYDVEYLKFFN